MLTTADRQRIVDALMTQANQIEEPHFVREMAECAWHDLALMEPVLNEILRNAEARGRLAGILDILAGQREKRIRQQEELESVV